MKVLKVLGLLVIFTMLVGSTVLAATTPAISRWAFGGGGGQSTGSMVRVIGLLGQPVVGEATGGAIRLCSGLWCGGPRYRVFLPITLHDYVGYFQGSGECEPNDSYLQANGPLISGRDYTGYPNDTKDYFSIYTRKPGEITVSITGHTGQRTQLQLWQGPPQYNGSNRVALELLSAGQATISYSGPPGWYYVYIFTESGHNQTSAYTLRVTYPE